MRPHAPGYHIAIRVNQEDGRGSPHSVILCRGTMSVQENWDRIASLLDCCLDGKKGLPDVDEQNFQSAFFNLLVNPVKRGQLPLTCGSPRSPEIKHQGLASVQVKADFFSLEVFEGKLRRFVLRGETQNFKLLKIFWVWCSSKGDGLSTDHKEKKKHNPKSSHCSFTLPGIL